MTGRALVVQADALRLPLPDASVDLVVTSPPYFALRAYNAGPGEIGSEATPAEFLAALWAVMAEVKRVLKPSGSAFVNLGDKYAGNTGNMPSHNGSAVAGRSLNQVLGRREGQPGRVGPIREKSLLGLPWAFALGCTGMLAALGGPDPSLDLILRAPITLWKQNSLPESVRDRVRTSDQELLFHLVKSPRYYAAVDELRGPYAPKTFTTLQSGWGYAPDDTQHAQSKVSNWNDANGVTRADAMHPLGKLPGSVWPMTSEPLRLPAWLGVQHYAAFPSELPRRCILGWSPPGICVACGDGRWPVVERSEHFTPPGSGGNPVPSRARGVGFHGDGASSTLGLARDATILGYACRCTPFTDHPGSGESSGPDGRYGDHLAEGGGYANVGAGFEPSASGHGGLGDRPKVGPWREYHLAGWQAPPTRPSIVLDPFSGTGTTIGVARQLGRVGVGVDLSHAYCRVGRYRVFQSGDFGKAEARTWADRQGTLT